ncbi:CotH kinase family protein [Crateriforma conspicua]|uniref:CotH protein n=1 Tax=Crateriforma conspicua TaxID=2527996 RepID=A0A5C5Y156_9PLAN|nr:CotH kinase family protein [Crateriforma conspicua]TWT68698.1 CotH protein [Crateriforma conspicua]
MKKKRLLLIALFAVGGVMAVAYASVGPGKQESIELVDAFDADGNGWLDDIERGRARDEVRSSRAFQFDVRTIATRFSHAGSMPAVSTGGHVAKTETQAQQGDLYDTRVLRTIFIDFDTDDWEAELEDFHNTDVDLSADLTVDGQMYPDCGIRFRGASSYDHVGTGYKRSFNIAMDMADPDQRLMGYKTLNLLNAHGDDSMMSTVLYSHIARQYIPAPKANFVRVVINGEDWGIYTNAQQYNKEFLKENYDTKKGARWKVHGSPRGGGGLDYRGDDLNAYGHPYEIKSGGEKATAKLMQFCKVLNETPTEQLPEKLEAICDVDGLLWFLALDVGLINGDGYWVRASDYSIYLGKDDKFRFIPHDMNEAFRPARGGPGGPGGRGGFGFGGFDFPSFGLGGPPRRDDRAERGPGRGRQAGGESSPVGLDPFTAMSDADKPLYSKVLAVPAYRDQFLANLETLANESLNWETLEPFVQSQLQLITPVVKTETHSLTTYERFVATTSGEADQKQELEPEQRGPRNRPTLKDFAQGRSQYLLRYVADQGKAQRSDDN